MRNFLTIVILCLFLHVSGCRTDSGNELRVFAGAGMSGVLTELADKYLIETGETIAFNFASSGMIANQIISGAYADVFFSANRFWMSEVERSGKLDPEAITNFAFGDLVVITRRECPHRISRLEDLTGDEFERISIGDPAHVPAGEYAKQALKKRKIWSVLESRFVPAISVRAVVAYVEGGMVDAGIVYRSDAAVSERVMISFEISPALHEPIIFQAGVVKSGKVARAKRFIDFVTGNKAREVLVKHGFELATQHDRQ